jgi:hypothetical protein
LFLRGRDAGRRGARFRVADGAGAGAGDPGEQVDAGVFSGSGRTYRYVFPA